MKILMNVKKGLNLMEAHTVSGAVNDIYSCFTSSYAKFNKIGEDNYRKITQEWLTTLSLLLHLEAPPSEIM